MILLDKLHNRIFRVIGFGLIMLAACAPAAPAAPAAPVEVEV